MSAPIFKSITNLNRIILNKNVAWILVITTAASLTIAAYTM